MRCKFFFVGHLCEKFRMLKSTFSYDAGHIMKYQLYTYLFHCNYCHTIFIYVSINVTCLQFDSVVLSVIWCKWGKNPSQYAKLCLPYEHIDLPELSVCPSVCHKLCSTPKSRTIKPSLQISKECCSAWVVMHLHHKFDNLQMLLFSSPEHEMLKLSYWLGQMSGLMCPLLFEVTFFAQSLWNFVRIMKVRTRSKLCQSDQN